MKGLNLFIHCLDIRMVFIENTNVLGWLGSVIRNNLLYATDGIFIEEENKTLRELINKIELAENHPLYSELKNGFPAPYIISLNNHRTLNSTCCLKQGDIVSFSLVLIGKITAYYRFFIKAIQEMCRRGLGTPMHPVLLLDIFERPYEGEKNLLFAQGESLFPELKHPIGLSHFFSEKKQENLVVKIRLMTPVSIYKISKKEANPDSYQCKMNGFPSFYQFIRSLLNRFIKLAELYGVAENTISEYQHCLEEFLQQALRVELKSANINARRVKGTLRKGKDSLIIYSGYTGELVFMGVSYKYLPYLYYMQYLGVGDNVVYGMGQYVVELSPFMK